MKLQWWNWSENRIKKNIAAIQSGRIVNLEFGIIGNIRVEGCSKISDYVVMYRGKDKNTTQGFARVMRKISCLQEHLTNTATAVGY